MTTRILAFYVLCFSIFPNNSQAEDWKEFQEGERIIFFGDSITQNGTYINYFESYLLTRFPSKKFEIINHGISSETISGTSETDHHPQRPWALPRFQRDITAWKPDLVISCFGMNDGNYHPFEQTRFQKFQKGIRELIRRTKTEANAKLIMMTPPPFDPYRRSSGDPKAKSYGYKFSAIDYDNTLKQYSRWLVELRKEGYRVVDLHSLMNRHLKERRKTRVSFYLSPDSVHPNSTGHWLMAQHLLSALKMPAVVSEAEIDAEKLRSPKGDISNLKIEAQRISFEWKTKLPMPMNPAWDSESIALEKVPEKFNRLMLSINNLKPGRYQVTVDGTQFGGDFVTEKQLKKGLNLSTNPTLSINKRALQLGKLVRQRRDIHYSEWRSSIKPEKQHKKSSIGILQRLTKLDEQIEHVRKPVTLKIRIFPAD